MKRYVIVAGDPSGDLIASRLVESLKKMDPSCFVVAVGGVNLEKNSDQFLTNIVEHHALGFAISPQKIRIFHRILNRVIKPELEKNPPDMVILVDFYGFNSRVAAMAKSLGNRVVYYVSPQFWASRPGRAMRIRHNVDLFLCLFPFELEFYRKHQLPAQFVGHPILDVLPVADPDRKIRVESLIGLLPGSRPDEIRRHLPVMIDACRRISKEFPGTRFVLFTVAHVHRDFYLDLISQSGGVSFFIELIRDEHFEWRSQLDAAISASGMETLENALLGIPMVVMYKTNWITYFVARSLIQIQYLAMPNLLANKPLVPEFIQHHATASNIAGPILSWLKNKDLRITLRHELLELRKQFGDLGASDRAAKAIMEKTAI